MLYILEGCDGTGKTTLAKKLQPLLGADIIHCTATTPNDMEFFANIAEAAADKHIIADRFCYGQFIYQQESERRLRDIDRDSITMLGHLEAKMLKCGVQAIYVYASPDEIKERLSMRDEVIINGLSVEEVLAKYEALKKMSILPWIDWNTGGEN